MISSSRFKLISMRSSDAPPRGPCSHTLIATSVFRCSFWAPFVVAVVVVAAAGVVVVVSLTSSSSVAIWLVARTTRLNVPCPNSLMARHRLSFPSFLPRASKYSKPGLLVAEPSLLCDDSLGGGVGGLAIGARPRDSDKCGSRRMWGTGEPLPSLPGAPPCGPETVVCLFHGKPFGSGIYSLILLFRVCSTFPLLVSSAWLTLRPAYTFLLVWCANAEATDSPLAVMSTESFITGGIAPSRDARDDERPRSCFQGPGESFDKSGEGRGVTLPIADIIGLG